MTQLEKAEAVVAGLRDEIECEWCGHYVEAKETIRWAYLKPTWSSPMVITCRPCWKRAADNGATMITYAGWEPHCEQAKFFREPATGYFDCSFE